MRYFYYVNSAYQLMNVLNLNNHRKNGFENIEDYKADLFLLNTFNGADKIYGHLKEKDYFDNVYIIDKKTNKGKLHTVYSLLDSLSSSFYFSSKYGFEKSFLKNKYDVISTPKYSIFVDQICRMNRKAEIELFEEGSASYNPIDLLEMQPRLYKKVDKVLHNGVDLTEYKRIYLVNEDMYFSDYKDRVIEIPKFDDDFLNELCVLFEDINRQSVDKPIYWISQFLNNEEFNRMVDEVLSNVNKYHDDVLFCQHPRNHMDNKYGFAESDGSHIWELKVLGMKDINEKLLVAIHSTACFSPKMLFDKEPFIIFIYKLGSYEVSNMTPAFEKMIEVFKNSYSNPDKVMIPEDMEELKECLKKYNERTI
ncbi:MAG: hypothetical protein Q4D13_00735 [Erysipelotrichaceae bacterium]|nr:hypothetical protein [Erysipelotrichaceae bacterium]